MLGKRCKPEEIVTKRGQANAPAYCHATKSHASHCVFLDTSYGMTVHF